MSSPQMFRKTEEREFFAHHMLLHAAELEIADAEATERGRFNKCLAAMVMTALAVEALVNAVGSRVVADWPSFERRRPHDKIDLLVAQLSITRDPANEPWSTLQFLGGFRNDLAHPKPKPIAKEVVLPEAGLNKTAFDRPLSKLEREITPGNARRAYAAVHALKGMRLIRSTQVTGVPGARDGAWRPSGSGTESDREPPLAVRGDRRASRGDGIVVG